MARQRSESQLPSLPSKSHGMRTISIDSLYIKKKVDRFKSLGFFLLRSLEILLLVAFPVNQMGRGRVQLRRIEDKTSRQVSFSKRRSGLLKKANELAVLCDAEVGLLIFSAKGKLYEYSSAPSMDNIIQRYREFSDAERNVNKDNLPAQNPNVPQSQVEEFACPRTNAELMEIAQRYLDDTNIDQLSATELEQIEKKLDAALRQTMSRKANLMMDMIAKLREKGKMLQEERQFLESVMESEKAAEKESDHHQTAAEGSTANNVNALQGMWWQPLQHFQVLMDM